MNFITKRIRQIFLMKGMHKRVIAGALTFCMVFTTMFSNAMLAASADETGGNVNLTEFKVTIGGKSPEEAGPIQDGQELKIDFTWSLSNDDRTNTVFAADITPLQNIVLVNYPEADLIVDGYGVVGKYSIMGNRFVITLNKDDGGDGQEFYEDNDRRGWAHITGSIKVNDSNAKDGDELEYKIGTTSGKFEYDKQVTASTLGVSKSAQGKVEKVGDKYQPIFRVTVRANNGDISGITLTDTMGSGLSNLSNVKVVETTSDSFAVGSSYADVNAPFSGVTLEKDTYVTLEYTVDVNPSVYSANVDGNAFKNKIKATYKDNLSQDQVTETGDVSVEVNRPSISKEGKIPAGEKYAEWVITIRLNDLKDDATFQELVTSVVDTPGTGFAGSGVPVAISPSDFTETSQGSGVYTYTYKTDITDEYYNSVSQLNLKNEVKATIGENEYTAHNTVTTQGVADIIKKEVVENSFDSNTGMLQWKVTIDTTKFPYDDDISDGDDNVKGLVICDRESDVGGDITGSHTVNGAPNVQIWVDNVQVVDNGNIVDENGNRLKDQWGNYSNSVSNGIIDSCTGYYTRDIRIVDEYLLEKIKTGTPIEVIFQSYIKDTDRANKLYQNTASAKYIDPVTDAEASTQPVYAQWKDTNVLKNAVEKSGAQVTGKNSIEYTVKVNTANIADMVAGEDIILEDVLPDNMIYDEGSFTLKDYYKSTWQYEQLQDWRYNQASAAPSAGSASVYEDAGVKKLKIVIPVTDNVIRLGEYAKTIDAEHYLEFKYTTTVEDTQTFLKNGVPTAFVNTISGKFGEDTIGGDSSTTVLTPQTVVTKGEDYSQLTCPNVAYSVEVNPQALDLSDGPLTAVDRIGSALSYNLNSIKVYENVDGTWVQLTSGYSYVRDLEQNGIIFTLPDSKWLKIEYTARVLLEYSDDPSENGQLTAENAFNSFELSGVQKSVGSSSVQTVSAVIQPAVGAEATTGYITLWKYWGETGSAHPLDGCTFAIYETDYDAATSTYTKKDVVFKDNIVVNKNGEVTVYRLIKDKVYALVETGAKDGYKLNTEPYYFVIPSDDAKKADFEGTNANIYTGTAPTLPFKNEVDDNKGIIKLGKEVNGLSFDKAKESIEFTIKGSNGYSKTITGEELKEYGNVITIADLEPGNYTIEETERDVDGYTCTSTTYRIDSAGAVTGTETGNFEVKANETTEVVFENTYEQVKGSLQLTKIVKALDQASPPEFSKVQDTLSFMITGPGGYSKEVKGADLDSATQSVTIDNLVPGEYKVVETIGLVNGYSRVETENVVTVPGQASVSSDGITAATVMVVGADTTKVDYTNTYEAGKGSIRLKKSSSGLTFDQIKDYITFTIKGPNGYNESFEGEELIEPGNSLEIGGLVPGTYEVEETATTPSGYTLYKTTYSVSTVDGGSAKTGNATGEFALGIGDIIEVSFENLYEQNRGALRISKTVKGAGLAFGDVDDSLSFVINGPGYHEEIDGVLLTQTGNSFLIEDLVPGTYTIAEKHTGLDGYDLVKVENVIGGETKEGTDAEFTVSSDVTTQVAYTNTYEYGKGSIRLKKSTSGADFSDIKDTLEYTITGPNNYEKQIKGSELVEEGNSITIAGLVPGKYTIRESKHDDSDRYAYKETVFKVNGGANQQGDEASDIALEAGKILEVEFTNTYDLILGRMKLAKNVSISGSGSVTLDDVRGSLTFRITGPKNYNKIYTGTDLTVDGNALLLTDLVPGTYIITEETTAVANYDLIRTDYVKNGISTPGKIATVIVEPSKTADEVTLIEFNNAYEKKKGSLKLVKTVTGDGVSVTLADVKEKLSFDITGPDGYKRHVKGTELNEADGSLTITGLVVGEYTIEEMVDDVPGKAVYVSTTNSDPSATDQKTAKTTIAADTLSTVTFNNKYEKYPSTWGTLVITKTIKGDVTKEEAEGALKFKVTKNATGASSVYTLQDEEFVYDSATGKYTLTLEKVQHGYTVEETVSTIDGYNVTVKSSVGTAALEDKDEQTVDIGAGETVYVNFEDDYKLKVGSLKLSKSLIGGVPAADALDGITFQITGPKNTSLTIKGSELTDAGYSKTIPNLPIGVYTIVETAGDTDEYTYVATVNDAGDGKTTAEVTVSEGAVAELTFTNTYSQKPGKLIITKTIKGDVTEEEAEGLLTFKVTDTATDHTDIYTLDQFTHVPGTDVYTLELEMPKGTYKVEETTYDMAGRTVKVTHSVNGAQAIAKAEAEAPVTPGDTTTVDFEDNYEWITGNLKITKQLRGDVTKEEAEGALQFKVTNLTTGKVTTYTLKDFVYNAAEGIYELNLETNIGGYIVEETIYDVKGYITDSVTYKIDGGAETAGTKADTKVVKDKTTEVAFADTYTKNVGKLVLTKSVQGDLIWDDVKDKLSFVVKNKATGTSKTYTATDFTDPNKNGVYTVVIDGLEPGEYTVTEKLGDVKGYLLETSYRIDGGNKQIGTEASVKLTKDGLKLDFVNTYTSTKGKLRITKTLLGNIKRGDAEDALQFKVKNEKTGKSKKYTLEDFTYDKENKEYVLELTLEAGKYTVTETKYDVKGYELRSVTYTVGDGEKTEGASAKVKVKSGKTTELAFADRYIKKRTSDRTDTTSDTPSTNTNTTTDRNTPKTGDESPLALWFAMMLLGAFGIGGSVYGLRKHKKD